MSIEFPFIFLEAEELDAMQTGVDCRELRDLKSVDGNYHVYLFKTDIPSEKEYMVFQYYDPEDEDGGYLPDNIWSRIFIGPSFGEGTQLIQHGLLTIPLIVINEHNDSSIVEIKNDGIIAFEINGNKELGKKAYLWMKQTKVEDIFRILGEQIIDLYVSSTLGGGASRFLINKT